eukprot:2856271-Pyramimonas_sp.AAC.1
MHGSARSSLANFARRLRCAKFSTSAMSCPPSMPQVGTGWKCARTAEGDAPGCSTPSPATAPSS